MVQHSISLPFWMTEFIVIQGVRLTDFNYLCKRDFCSGLLPALSTVLYLPSDPKNGPYRKASWDSLTCQSWTGKRCSFWTLVKWFSTLNISRVPRVSISAIVLLLNCLWKVVRPRAGRDTPPQERDVFIRIISMFANEMNSSIRQMRFHSLFYTWSGPFADNSFVSTGESSLWLLEYLRTVAS